MKYAHTVSIRVFSHPDEDYEKIKKAFLGLVGFDLQKEKLRLQETIASGFNEAGIKIISLSLSKERHTNMFLEHLAQILNSEQKSLFLHGPEERMDKNFNFFLRLDKERLMNNEYGITDSGSCFHITICLACFPKNMENAAKVLKNIFQRNS